MTIIQATLFDYNELDTETRIVVQQRTSEIKALMRRAASDIIEIGQKLRDVKARLGHGGFIPWLVVEFDWSWDTARRFMRVAETFENQQIADFQIAPSALYLLSAPSTPDSARQEALERAESGETITHGLARDIVAEHKPSAPIFTPTYQDEEDNEPLTDYEQGIADRFGHNPLPVLQPNASNAPINFSPADSVEWYTPSRYIEAARAVMGGFDTDPASNDTAQSIIQAETYYTIDDDGFTKPWHGRVWLNPPYGVENGKAVAGKWADRLIDQYRRGITIEAILLVNAVIDSKWFNVLWQFPICFTDHRIRFELPSNAPDNANTSPVIGSAIVYLGSNVAAFVREFSQFGAVVARLHAYEDQIFTEMEIEHGVND